MRTGRFPFEPDGPTAAPARVSEAAGDNQNSAPNAAPAIQL
jgi:hypothetical protein